MTTDHSLDSERHSFPLQRVIPIGASILVITVGVMVLIGWQFDIAILKTFLPGAVSMAPNTAVAFLLAGIALLLLQRTHRVVHWLVRFLALLIMLVGILSFCQNLFGWDIGFDEILFRAPEGVIDMSHPSLMAPTTALNFMLLGVAFFLLTFQRLWGSFIVELPLVFSLSVSIIGFLGYLTGFNELAGPAAYTKMAVHAAGAFIILCFGVIVTIYKQQRSPITTEQKLLAGLTVAVAVIVLISFLSVSGITSLVQAGDWIEHTQEVKNQINLVLSHVLEVQSGERGFVLTGDDDYLVARNKALDELPTLMKNLRLQMADNPQQETFAALETLVHERMAFSAQIISIRKTESETKARLLFSTGREKMIVDSIRVLVAQMFAEEDRLLQTRRDDETQQAKRNQLIIYISLAVQVLLLAFIFVVMNRDVSGRRKAEKETHRQKEFVDSIIENIPAMVFLKDAKELRFVLFNRAGEELLGYKREDLVGKNDYDFFPKEEADFFTAKDREVLLSNEIADIAEEPIQTRNKGLRFLHTRKISLCNEHGEPEYLLGISEDITERKRIEESLRKKTEELDRYFTNSLDLLCIADTDGYFRRLNPTWEKTLGYSLKDLEGKQFMEFVHPDDIPSTLEAVSQLSAQKEVVHFLNRYRHSDGTYRWIEWRSYPDGKLIYASARDITERKEAEEKIRQANTQLATANKELGAFSYSVSHDLRAPLRHITGFVELLQKHAGATLDEKSTRYLKTISQSAVRMGSLIDDLLSFSRMGRQEMQKTTVEMNDMIAGIVKDLESHTKGRVIEWHIGQFPHIKGDRAMLRLAMVNLLHNAAKFTSKKEKAVIEVRCEIKEKEITGFVKDNGAGFDMQYADKLFGVFQRLHNAEEFEGTGVGLANVRRIIQRHGGRTWAEGKVNEGAAFYFTIPLDTEERSSL